MLRSYSVHASLWRGANHEMIKTGRTSSNADIRSGDVFFFHTQQPFIDVH